MAGGLRRAAALLRWAVLLATLFPVDAQATCDPHAPQVVIAHPVTLQERFDALYAMDKYKDFAAMATRWQALIGAAKADPKANAEVLSRASTWFAWTLGDTQRADEMLAAAEAGERVADENGLADHPFYAETLGMLAAVEVGSGKMDAAARHAQAAHAHVLAHIGPDSVEAGFVEGVLGYLDLARGHYLDADRHYATALATEIKCARPDDALIGDLINTHATTLDSVGQHEESLAEHYHAADWAIAHTEETSLERTNALAGLATSLSKINRLNEAEAIFHVVLDRQARYEPDNWIYRATYLSNFGDVLNRMGRGEEAEALWLKSREFYERANNKRDPGLTTQPIVFAASAAAARGDLALALTRFDAAERQLAALVGKDNVRLALNRVTHASVLALAGRTADAVALATPAMTVIRTLRPDDLRRMIAEMSFAQIVAKVDGPDAAFRGIQPTFALLETKLLDTATSRVELIKYAPTFASSFGVYVDLALATGHVEDAFRALQLANLSEIAIVSSEVAARAAAGNPAAAETSRRLLDHVRLRQALDKERAGIAGAGQPEALVRITAAIAVNDTAIAEDGRALDRLFPEYRTLGRPSPVALADFRASLASDQILLAPLPVADGTLAIAVTRDGLIWAKSVTARPGIAALVARVRRSIDAARADPVGQAPFDTAAASELFGAIAAGNVGRTLKTRSSLRFFASGPLATLSPGLLVTAPARTAKLADQRWLIRDHDVTIVTSLALPSTRAMAGPVPAGFLGVGAPQTGPAPPSRPAERAFRSAEVDRKVLRELPPLPAAARELGAIARAMGGAGTMLLTGALATEDRLRAAPLDHFALIAFATHGVSASDVAGLDEPALVLTPPAGGSGKGDGLLTASKIAGLRLNADWVILSACNSAGALARGSPAYSGLASAFIAAGARALLVSHWPVRDDAAEAISVETVRWSRTGVTRAVALQRAMLDVMNSRTVPQAAHPAIWAPFVLIDR